MPRRSAALDRAAAAGTRGGGRLPARRPGTSGPLLGCDRPGSAPALTLPPRRACCRPLVSGGFARVAGCRLSPSRRCLGAICLSRSERRSLSCSLRSWSAEDRPSAGSCAVDDLHRTTNAVALRTGRPEYRASTAQTHADRRARRPKPAKLAVNPEFARVVMCRTGLPGLFSGLTGALLVRGRLARAASRTAKGPALGTVLEPGADRQPTPG